MTPTPPCIVLVNPQMGENIGAAARAMLNFGLSDLRLVNPRDGWPNQAAIDNSAGALDIMPPVRVYKSLSEAVGNCHYVYGTTARDRDMSQIKLGLNEAVSETLERAEKTAFVFGPERTGLENDDLALCHAVISIPTNPEFSSINLGQAVLLLAYDWSIMQGPKLVRELNTGDSFPAPHAKLEEFFVRMEEELENGKFFRDEGLKPTMKRNIRNMFMRAEMTDQEVRTFHGIISALSGKKAP